MNLRETFYKDTDWIQLGQMVSFVNKILNLVFPKEVANSLTN